MSAEKVIHPPGGTDEVKTEQVTYDDDIVRNFVWASTGWGVIGMLVGVIIALQLAWAPANFASWATFGRLRPLHTNAVIFAFVGNMMFAGIYYSTQRLTRARLASDMLSKIHFWGWQAIIVSAVVTLPLGITTSKEYAELEWPIDIAITLIWVVFAANFFLTLARRREKHLYVALWFYIATIITIALLHIVNSLAIPISLFKSYSLFGGAQDALVQWWYGHNAVAFFLTTPVLGIMYYFVPKAAERPVYSYRLSIIHFWALVFMYIWAGPHHLLFTALPDWAQTIGMIFSLTLWAPSWGGMINGLLTLRGAWGKLRTDPVLKFFAAGITFYGMATFEGPLLSIKAVSGLAHYTDWIVGHVHSGALGWNGFMAAGMFYWLIPRLYGRKELHSTKAADAHFYMGTFGILLYVISMWVSGVTQGLMWRALTSNGALQYPNFLETVIAIKLMYWARLTGGTLYLVGMCVMLWNLAMTARAGAAVHTTVEVTYVEHHAPEVHWSQVVFGMPVLVTVVVMGLLGTLAFVDGMAGVFTVSMAFGIAVVAALLMQVSRGAGGASWHRMLEGRPLVFTAFTTLGVLIGGVVEIVPMVLTKPTDPRVTSAPAPLRPLELAGRDIYVSEGCYTCHSQMIRPFRWETQRYGDRSTIMDSVWDHPFQWGSKRTGPDLARVGGKYPNLWHYRHMLNPRAIASESNMPAYGHLARNTVNFANIASSMRALRTVGVPYQQAQIDRAQSDANLQANAIVADLREQGAEAAPTSELVALIAYLQRLGVANPGPLAPAAPQAASPTPATP
ncbi:MAG: cytochrome-c oxidase, cbb3-type subunit I [Deltaproteobacteria bacterium]|nr:cytochrome-c oxidase, cbb3-type subunit I [Deltaproteobacteria bacterium]